MSATSPRLAAGLIVTMALLFAIAANGDVPPEPNSPDAHCTPAQQCPNGVYCPYAFRPGRQPKEGEVPVGQDCRNSARSKELERRCRNGGNYGGNELFCPKGETGSWSPVANSRAVPASSSPPASSSSAQPNTSPPPTNEAGATKGGCSGCFFASRGDLQADRWMPVAVLLLLFRRRR